MQQTQALNPGDEIRVIAPSSSQRTSSKRQYERAQERLESLGYKVTFGKFVGDKLHLGVAAAQDRATDFNNAFSDPDVKAVIAMHGGWLANEILPYIDWSAISNNPKPLIGFSDITVLLNAIYAKAGVVTYLGPNFASIGHMRSWEYTLESLDKALKHTEYEPRPSKLWGVGTQKKGHRTKPWHVLQQGSAEATLLGGNASTLHLLQGTECQPPFDSDFILAFEDDDQSGKVTAHEFSRKLESLLQLPNFRDQIRGMIIGRFMPESKLTDKVLMGIIVSKHLDGIPIIAGLDFGHTLPMLTLPIGGKIKIVATNSRANVSLKWS